MVVTTVTTATVCSPLRHQCTDRHGTALGMDNIVPRNWLSALVPGMVRAAGSDPQPTPKMNRRVEDNYGWNAEKARYTLVSNPEWLLFNTPL